MTHSLFGYALARGLPGHDRASPERKRAEVWTSVVASNLPDADVVLGLFARDRRLAYLLEHRGPTHTLLAALPIGIVSGCACAAIARANSARDRWVCSLLGVLACLLHIGFDSLNNYGVHPFSPFDDHWFYGDSLFIVEPLLLFALLPLVAWHAYTSIGRAMGFALGGLLFALLFLPRGVPAEVALPLAVLLPLSYLSQRRVRRPGLVALGATAMVVLLFGASAQSARAQVLRSFTTRAPRERLFDVVITPAPGNPLCFSALLIGVDDRGLYRAHFAHVSVANDLFPVSKCKVMPRGPTTAPLDADPLNAAGPVRFGLVFQADPSRLRRLFETHCDARAMMRFIRAPFWIEQNGRDVLGDLRYDSSPQLEFAERELDDVCRESFPEWLPPRADLLRAP